MSVATNCFEGSIMRHSNSCLGNDVDPLQFDYHHYRSTVDMIFSHSLLSQDHWVNKKTYIKLLFIVYSSVFSIRTGSVQPYAIGSSTSS